MYLIWCADMENSVHRPKLEILRWGHTLELLLASVLIFVSLAQPLVGTLGYTAHVTTGFPRFSKLPSLLTRLDREDEQMGELYADCLGFEPGAMNSWLDMLT